MRLVVLPIAVIAVVGLALGGCAGRTGDGTPAPSESPAEASSATCENLLEVSTIDKLEEKGSSFSDNKKEDTYPFSDFLQYGGISCVWGASLTVTTAFTYGPISDEDSAAQQKKLAKEASKSGLNENGGTYYEVPGGESGVDDAEIFVFSPKGYWAWGFDNGGGQVIEEVVANAPVFY